MTHQQKRCVRCSDRYYYQGSGEGCGAALNDDRYCPSCKQIIIDALKDVPQKYTREFVVCLPEEMTVPKILEIEQAQLEDQKASGKMFFRRVAMNLYNMEDPSDHHKTGYVKTDGKLYLYEYWSKMGPERGQVCIECEIETETHKVTGPWSFTDRWAPWPKYDQSIERGIVYEPDPNAPKMKFVRKPLAMLKQRRFDIIERSQSLSDVQDRLSTDGQGNPVHAVVGTDGSIGTSAVIVDHIDERAKPYGGDMAMSEAMLREDQKIFDALDALCNESPVTGNLDMESIGKEVANEFIAGRREFKPNRLKEFTKEDLPDGALPVYSSEGPGSTTEVRKADNFYRKP